MDFSTQREANGPALTVLEKYIRRGMGNAGFAAASFGYLFYEWDTTVGLLSTATNGTRSVSTTLAGAVTTLTSTATANSFIYYQPGQTGNVPSLILSGATQKFYIASRFAVTSAIDAQARVGCGFLDSGGQLRMVGVAGSISTTKFCSDGRTGATGGIASTVSIDTNFHTFEHWNNGTTQAVSVDDEAPVTATAATAFSSIVLPGCACYAGNGTTAAARTASFDWTLLMFPIN